MEQRNRVLLMQRAERPFKGRWGIPGGFCHPGEHPAQTAVREVLEETGLEIQITGFLGMWPDRRRDEGIVQPTLNIFYTAETVAATGAASSSETRNVDWFAISKIPVRLAFPGHIPAVLAAVGARGRNLPYKGRDLKTG